MVTVHPPLQTTDCNPPRSSLSLLDSDPSLDSSNHSTRDQFLLLTPLNPSLAHISEISGPLPTSDSPLDQNSQLLTFILVMPVLCLYPSSELMFGPSLFLGVAILLSSHLSSHSLATYKASSVATCTTNPTLRNRSFFN